MNYLLKLNHAQKEAVCRTEGPLMILAGAGSGKTRTLTMRVAHLIKGLGVEPYNILALTFSNKAAREMKDRVMNLVGSLAIQTQISTFHSFCAKILRIESSYLGLAKNFVIYDQGEAKTVIKNILQRHDINIKELPPATVLNYIEGLKNDGYYLEKGVPDDKEFYNFYGEYEAELAKSNSVDFGGLITGTIQLFNKNPSILQKYQRRFHYILVDEYQDTNRAQFELITLIAKGRGNICVVGDEDQSIYSWRGANINNIFDFEDHFPSAGIIKLEQNYRSTKNIIEGAGFVIAKNKQRKGKTMFTENPRGDKIKVVECSSEKEEALLVSRKIKELIPQISSLNQVAVFYRTNYQSRIIEDFLLENKIPYRIIGGVRFYERKEVKDMIAYLKLTSNPQDSLALARIINVPARGIGTRTLKNIETIGQEHGLSLWSAIEYALSTSSTLSRKVATSLQEFYSFIAGVQKLNQEGVSPSVIYEKLLQDSGYWDYLNATKNYEATSRRENLQEFFAAIKQYEEGVQNPSLNGFLEQVSLESSGDENETQGIKGEVSLMTVHGAKGLEFPHVFIVGAEEDVFPSYQSLEDGGDRVEEERRLFYVAMTRAMNSLSIFFARGRMFFGKIKFNAPSRFIREIPDNFYKAEKGGSFGLDKDEDNGLYKGQVVKHHQYGMGKIMAIKGHGDDERATILFNSGKRKNFMLKYTPLEYL